MKIINYLFKQLGYYPIYKIEATVKYAYCRGFNVGKVWKDHPSPEVANAEYQWETAGQYYCLDELRR